MPWRLFGWSLAVFVSILIWAAILWATGAFGVYGADAPRSPVPQRIRARAPASAHPNPVPAIALMDLPLKLLAKHPVLIYLPR